MKTHVFAQVLYVKAISSCGGDFLHRHSRVAGFDDIIDFGLRMYQFYFRYVFCELLKYNIITLALHFKWVLHAQTCSFKRPKQREELPATTEA
jgi:hypothetical protein